jgi:hypothetical protein
MERALPGSAAIARGNPFAAAGAAMALSQWVDSESFENGAHRQIMP